jgi:hypothetical protein
MSFDDAWPTRQCARCGRTNQRATPPRCSVNPALLAGLAFDLLVSFGCIYFGKCRKECRCQRVADSTGETTATLGCVSKLRGSHDHHLLRYGNNAFQNKGRAESKSVQNSSPRDITLS